MSLVLTVVLAASALPGFSQAAPAKAPQLKTQPEYNSYTACFNEKDPAKKADLCAHRGSLTFLPPVEGFSKWAS